MREDIVDWRFALAERGREFWLARSLDDFDIVLLLPTANDPLTAVLPAALEKRIQEMAERGEFGQPRVVVLSTVPPPPSLSYTAITVTEEETRALLSLYCMYEFSDKLVIGSLGSPTGRKSSNLLNGGVASAAELAATIFF